MSDAPSLGVAVAFVGGILSFLSPCVLPLVPSYFGFLTGLTLPEMTNRRRVALLHAVVFVAGFSVVFIALGLGATALGRALRVYDVWLARVGGALIVVFGLYLMGVLRIPGFGREQRIHLEDKPVGFAGSFVVGMTFAAGWTPCLGPVLSAILGLAATETDLARGAMLLGAYSAGLAVPFLLAALAVDRFIEWFRRFRHHLGLVQKASGALLVAVGLLLLSGQFTRLAGWLQGLTPGFLKQYL
ncbi:MAG TPA: cytochrome c biogenesis protein CcdA [Gemmatimonadales bacterium]|nr:cytochrome c biogenesis protein CcdA [Gemmatimonadales bacterium]